MKRSTKVTVQKDPKKSPSVTPSRKASVPEAESHSMDRLEGLHYESQQIQSLVETLLVKMKQNISVQVYLFSKK
jgi:hypothetical protein